MDGRKEQVVGDTIEGQEGAMAAVVSEWASEEFLGGELSTERALSACVL